MHKVEICDKCKGTNINTLLPKIKKLSNDLEIKIGCINYCGIGRDKICILFDHMPIIKDNEKDIIDEIKKRL